MDNNSWRAKGPSALRKECGMLSRSAAPLPFILLMANCSSPIFVDNILRNCDIKSIFRNFVESMPQNKAIVETFMQNMIGSFYSLIT